MMMMKKFNKNIVAKTLLLSAASLFSGCAAMNGNFSCDASSRGSCAPVSDINQKAQSGYFNQRLHRKGVASQFIVESGGEGRSTLTYNYSKKGGPSRSQEHVQRIWISPYEDLSHNYHDSSTIYAVLDKPHWIGLPMKEIVPTEL